MVDMSGLTLNLNLDTSDRINALFPKCRPRRSSGQPYTYSKETDINLNSISNSEDTLDNLTMDSTVDRSCDNHSSSLVDRGGREVSQDEESPLDDSSGEEDEEIPSSVGGPNLMLQLKSQATHNSPAIVTPATTFKLKDSRIIEIAGGREVYCQSRAKSARAKSGQGSHGKPSVNTGVSSRQHKVRGVGGDIWQLRSKLHAQCVVQPQQTDHTDMGCNPVVTETVFSNEVSSVKHSRQQNNLSSEGEGCVVFDDISNDEWPQGGQHRRAPRHQSGPPLSSGGSSPSPPLHRYPFHDLSSNHSLYFHQQSESQAHKHSTERFEGRGGGSSEASLSSDSKHSGTSYSQRVQGSPVQIAQYEGSPRRYGNTNKLTEPNELFVCANKLTEPNGFYSSANKLSEPNGLYNSSNKLSEPPVLPSLLSSPSVYLPKPGFPQRVLEDDSNTCSNVSPVVDSSPPLVQSPGFDYLYEFSETRKVLEEFFKPGDAVSNINTVTSGSNGHQFRDLDYKLRRQNSLEKKKKKRKGVVGNGGRGSSYVGLRLATDEQGRDRSPGNSSQESSASTDMNKERDLLSGYSVSTEMLTNSSGGMYPHNRHSRAVSRSSYPHHSPPSETEMLATEGGPNELLNISGPSRNFTLSPETTDCESNCGDLDSEISSLVLVMDEVGTSGIVTGTGLTILPLHGADKPYPGMPVLEDGLSSGHASDTENNNATVLLMKRQISEIEQEIVVQRSYHNKLVDETSSTGCGGTTIDQAFSRCPSTCTTTTTPSPLITQTRGSKKDILDPGDIDLTSLDPLNGSSCNTEAPSVDRLGEGEEDSTALPTPAPTPQRDQCVEAALKDIRLTLQRTKALPVRSVETWIPTSTKTDQDEVVDAPVWIPRKSGGSGPSADEDDADTDLETDRLLGQQRTNDDGYFEDKMDKNGSSKKKGRNKEAMHEHSVLIEGVLFRARYLGSTQLVCEGQPTKSTRMMQAEEAVSRIKGPDGETQPSIEVDLFISTEKIMVLNTDLKEIMMDHALRTISYIADIGDLVVLMARRRIVNNDVDKPPKMICHVFESDEAQFIAQSIGQAFQVAYMKFLKANGIEDHSFVKEMDYQEVLNSQEIFGDELQMFAKKELQKEVVVPKGKGEILGVVIVESGWGSMLPTVVIANLAPTGAAVRCGQLNIGDQIIAVNGVSLVGLPLSTCQTYIKNSKNQTVVKLTVVPCAPVVEVTIKRPDTKYQLGFSVQNGVICSLLRGGIAERGGVRVGHRIIEINNQSVVAVPHEKIVHLLATSVGEILMKTMPTSMFRLLTGQETPVFI